jgi:CubicO group peptidase (beta-lactamase class C family)
MDVEGRSAPTAFRGDRLLRMSLAEYVAIASQQPLAFEPGSKWAYGSSDSYTLCRLAEVVSGKPYERFLEERIYHPLGMRDSSLSVSPAQKTRLATGYILRNGKLVANSFQRAAPEYILPQGLSTAPDLAAFFEALLKRGASAGGRILSEVSVREMTRVQTADLPTYPADSPWSGYRFGLGLWMIQTADKGLAGFSSGSYGGQGAGGTDAWVDPAKDLLWIILVQGGNADAARDAVRQIALSAVN